jgi:hypothetical protein
MFCCGFFESKEDKEVKLTIRREKNESKYTTKSHLMQFAIPKFFLFEYGVCHSEG